MSALLGGSTVDPEPDAHFTDLGGDSLSALTFANLLNDIFDVAWPAEQSVCQGRNISGVFDHDFVKSGIVALAELLDQEFVINGIVMCRESQRFFRGFGHNYYIRAPHWGKLTKNPGKLGKMLRQTSNSKKTQQWFDCRCEGKFWWIMLEI